MFSLLKSHFLNTNKAQPAERSREYLPITMPKHKVLQTIAHYHLKRILRRHLRQYKNYFTLVRVFAISGSDKTLYNIGITSFWLLSAALIYSALHGMLQKILMLLYCWYVRRESNPRPSAPETNAHTVGLRRGWFTIFVLENWSSILIRSVILILNYLHSSVCVPFACHQYHYTSHRYTVSGI